MSTTTPTPLPPPRHEAPDADFAALRELFQSSGFDLAAVLRRCRLRELHELDPLRVRHTDYGPVQTAADALVALLVEGKALEAGQLKASLGEAAESLLQRLGLLFTLDGGLRAATVALYPIGHIFVASDRYNSADGSEFQGFDEIVYPCLFETGWRFRRLVPKNASGGDVLDLCSGTAFAALLLAGSAGHVYAADITDRCAQFALFNQRLNGIANATILTGDLYAPVAGKQFDLIVTHAPYQPVFRYQQRFNSGGIDGEEISKRIVEEALAYLRPGGRLYCVAQFTARQNAVDRRVREWIGQAQGPSASAECDVAFYMTKRHEIELFAAKSTLISKGNQLDFQHWLRSFGQMGVRSLDYGVLIVERHASPRAPFTLSRTSSTQWDAADFEASFAWEVRTRQPGFDKEFWQIRLRANPNCRLLVEHFLSAEGWQIDGYQIAQSGPFEVKINASQGIAHLLGLMNGEATVEACFHAVQEAGMAVTREQFAETVISLASEGFLRT